MIGIAITFPTLWLISRIPWIAPGAEVARAQAQRMAGYFLNPGATAWRALLIYPVLEEMFFRGLMMPLLRRYFPGWLAVGVPTALFALTHFGGGWANVLFAAAMGLVFARLVIRTESLFPAIVCHVAVNVTGLFVLAPLLVAHGVLRLGDLQGGWLLVTLAASVGLALAAGRILRSETRRASRALAA